MTSDYMVLPEGLSFSVASYEKQRVHKTYLTPDFHGQASFKGEEIFRDVFNQISKTDIKSGQWTEKLLSIIEGTTHIIFKIPASENEPSCPETLIL